MSQLKLLTTDELLALPPATWLMKGVLPSEGLCALVGPPGNGKSFVAVDWACSISEGLPWLGTYETVQAPVVYIAAEGGRGIKKRVAAWMAHHNLEHLPAMYWLLNPLYVREEGVVEEFLDELDRQDIWPGLLVVDTLSRSFGGGEENASADMGSFVDRMTHLAQGRRMAALVVHHTNASGEKERGHTSFRGAMDAVFHCKAEQNKDNGRIERLCVKNTKQKDDVEAEPIWLRPIEHAGDSLLFEQTAAPEKKREGGPKAATPMRRIDMLTYLGGQPEGMTHREWMVGCQVPKPTFNKRLKKLIEDGAIYKDEGRYFVMPANADLAFQADED